MNTQKNIRTSNVKEKKNYDTAQACEFAEQLSTHTTKKTAILQQHGLFLNTKLYTRSKLTTAELILF
jgi:hypothetical protein